jgi:hypothetical protein
VLVLLLAALGCPHPTPTPTLDGSVYTGDSGEPPDASVDAGPVDAGSPDASIPDSGTDGGRPDAGPADAGFPDAGDGGETEDGGDAGPPPIIFSAQVIDFCNNYSPLEGVQVSLLGGGASALTDAQGNYSLPVQAGIPFTQVVQLTGYQTAYVGEVQIEADLLLTVTQIPLVCNSAYQSLTGSFTNFDTNEGVILAKVDTLASSGPCTDQSGWTFQITPSGGETYLYFDVTGTPNPTLTATESYGIGSVYDIAASRVLLSAQKPDAGCANAGAQVGLTGYVDLAPGILSYGGYFIE